MDNYLVCEVGKRVKLEPYITTFVPTRNQRQTKQKSKHKPTDMKAPKASKEKSFNKI